MPKRKKYPKLPNGYGSIKYLGKGRRNPYAVHPPTTEFTLDGIPITPKALCYVDSWIKGFTILTAYKAGTYTEGMEKTLTDLADDGNLEGLAQRILSDYNTVKGVEQKEAGPTFAEVYEDFYKWKYNSGKKYSDASKNSTRAAYKNCGILHDREFASLRYNDLQSIIDNCPLKHASLELIVSLFKQMYQYADLHEIIDKNCAEHVRINIDDDDIHGEPFTEKDLNRIWKLQEDPVAEMLIIMCYSGFCITEYIDIRIDFANKYFEGGIKTKAGKNRIVQSIPASYPLYEEE